MDKKALTREYKESRRPMGVYQIRNTLNGKLLVGVSVDLPSILNRHRADLRMGGHRNRELQKDWAEFGPEAFEFEILDTLKPLEQPDYDPSVDLWVLEELWLDKLSLFGERGYVLFPLSSASAYISRRKPPSYSLFGHDEWEKEAPAGWIPDLAACMQWCRPGDGAADRICADRRLS